MFTKIFKKIFTLTSFATVALLASNCSNDLSINAEPKDITVLYALMSQQDSIHVIKINKAYLGEGDAFDFAQIKDSIEYLPGEVKGRIIEYETSKSLDELRSWELLESTGYDKQDGIFYSDSILLYYFKATDLDASKYYKIELNIDRKTEVVSAGTPLINSTTLTWEKLFGDTRFGVNFANSGAVAYTYPDQFAVKFLTAQNAKRYTAKAVWKYTDYFLDGTFTEHLIEWELGTYVAANTLLSIEASLIVSPVQFYSLLKSEIPAKTATTNLDYRLGEPRIGFILYAGGDELNTYMEVKAPSTGLNQEKPEYTNVTNGIGIVSCRYYLKSGKTDTLEYLYKNFSKDSYDELVAKKVGTGKYTAELGFCYPYDYADISISDDLRCPN